MSQPTSLRQRASGGPVAHQQQAQGEPSIAQLIGQMRGEIARALPKHLDADRMARIALTVVRKEPKLANCTRESFMGALLTAAQLGLEPGAGGEAYLIPYGRECQFIIGYQGYAKLFWQHPLAAHLDAQAVYEADDFDYEMGLRPYLRHKPARGDRGAVTDYYAVGSLTTGVAEFLVLSPEDVKKLRGGKVGGNGGIADPMRWMERKSALRQLFKLLPKSATLTQALVADEGVRTDLRPDAIDDAGAFRHPALAATEPPEPAPTEPAKAAVQADPETGEVIPASVGDWGGAA